MQFAYVGGQWLNLSTVERFIERPTEGGGSPRIELVYSSGSIVALEGPESDTIRAYLWANSLDLVPREQANLALGGSALDEHSSSRVAGT
jgi:hypothetical protein